MTRYFFDVNAKSSLQYDYSGRSLAGIDEAHRLAELIAIDLACTQGERTRGYEVEVRDSAGKLFLSVPVHSAELTTA